MELVHMARDSKVVIRLTDEVKEEFQKLADSYGMTISALGSYVIGRHLSDIRKQQNLTSDMLQPLFNVLSDPEKLKGIIDLEEVGRLARADQG